MPPTRSGRRRLPAFLAALAVALGIVVAAAPAAAVGESISVSASASDNGGTLANTFKDANVTVTLSGFAAPPVGTIRITDDAGDAATREGMFTGPVSVQIPGRMITDTSLSFTASFYTGSYTAGATPAATTRFQMLAYASSATLVVNAPAPAAAYGSATFTGTVKVGDVGIAGVPVSAKIGFFGTALATVPTDAAGSFTLPVPTTMAGRLLGTVRVPTSYVVSTGTVMGAFAPKLEPATQTTSVTVSPATVSMSAPATTAAVDHRAVTTVTLAPGAPSAAVGDRVDVLRAGTAVASGTFADQAGTVTAALSIPADPAASVGTEGLDLRYVTRTTNGSIVAADVPLDVTWTARPTSTDVSVETVAPSSVTPVRVSAATMLADGAPAADGDVAFTVTDADGVAVGDPVASASTGGSASAVLAPLAPGTYTVTAAYVSSDPRTAGSEGSSAVTTTVVDTRTAGGLSAHRADVGGTVQYTVTVEADLDESETPDPEPTSTASASRLAVAAPTAGTGAAVVPEGSVTLVVDGTPVGAAVELVEGTAVLGVPTDAAGTFDIAARYSPADARFAASDSDPSELVVVAPVIVPTTPAPSGSPTATATPTPALSATGTGAPFGIAVLAGFLVVAGVATARVRTAR